MKTFEALQILLATDNSSEEFKKAYTDLVNKQLSQNEINYLKRSFDQFDLFSGVLSEERLNTLLRLFHDRINEIINAKKVILVVGQPGVGKGSLINYLSGVSFVLKYEESAGSIHLEPDPENLIKPLSKMAHGRCDRCEFPEVVSNNGFSYLEIPGLLILKDINEWDDIKRFSLFIAKHLIEKTKDISSAILLFPWSWRDSYHDAITTSAVHEMLFHFKTHHRHKPIVHVVSHVPGGNRYGNFNADLCREHIKLTISDLSKKSDHSGPYGYSIEEMNQLVKLHQSNLDLVTFIQKELSNQDFSPEKIAKLNYVLSALNELNKSSDSYTLINTIKDKLDDLSRYENSKQIIAADKSSHEILYAYGSPKRINEYFNSECLSLKEKIFDLNEQLKKKHFLATINQSENIFVFRGTQEKGDSLDDKIQILNAIRRASGMPEFRMEAVEPSASASSISCSNPNRLFASNNQDTQPKNIKSSEEENATAPLKNENIESAAKNCCSIM